MKKSSMIMYLMIALALLSLATNITVNADGAVTLEPGRDPTAAAQQECARPLARTSPLEPEIVRKEICCQAACRAYCVRDSMCMTICQNGCSA